MCYSRGGEKGTIFCNLGVFAYPRKKVQSRISSRLENAPLPLDYREVIITQSGDEQEGQLLRGEVLLNQDASLFSQVHLLFLFAGVDVASSPGRRFCPARTLGRREEPLSALLALAFSSG